VTGATFRLTTTLGPANPARRSRNRIMIDTRFLISADVVAMPTDRWNFGATLAARITPSGVLRNRASDHTLFIRLHLHFRNTAQVFIFILLC